MDKQKEYNKMYRAKQKEKLEKTQEWIDRQIILKKVREIELRIEESKLAYKKRILNEQ